MIDKVMVFDMDGVLVDSTHRYKTKINEAGKEVIDLEFWRKNEHRAMQDAPGPLFNYYKGLMQDPSVYIVIATARQLTAACHQYIDSVLGRPHHLISRPPEYTGSGAAMKLNGLRRIKNLKQFKHAAWHYYEDNLAYLSTVCSGLQISGTYIPSNQGH